MGQLPATRVPGYAFANTSVDYFGPVLMKRYNAKRVKIVDKAYVAVFVCMKTRAVHLELVSSETTEAFLASYSRFMHRRGPIESLTSDNAKNFVGASNEMTAIIEQWQAAAKSEQFEATKWHFLPPRAPHMGGIHEAAVKSAKHHLRRVIGSQQLTFEEFATLLTHVEACLNSRPLIPLTEEPNDSLALTPGHFLIGGPIKSPLMRDLVDVPSNRLSHFQLLQKIAQQFWARWSEEHVKSLINRSKWQQSQANIERNDIVLLINEAMPPTRWPLAKVMDVFPDEDGHVRMVDILFQGKIKRRPIHKLCRLPKEEESQPLLPPPEGGPCSE